MSIETIPLRVQHKRMTANEWRNSSLILLDGEIGVESDTGYLKVGDGRSTFTNLKYLKGDKGDRGEKGDKGEQGNPGRDGQVTFAALTQQQKNELKGAKGDKGEQGNPGIQGVTGKAGVDGKPGQNIINQQNNQPMKYWAGTEAQYNAIPAKDANTIYDIFK